MPWRIGGHRIHLGWIVIFAVVLVAAGGGFGGMPWTRLSISSADGKLRLEYEGLWRMNAPTTLKLQMYDASALGTGSVRIDVDRAYLENVRIDSILPEPHLVLGATDRVSFHFLGDPESPSTSVSFAVTPLTIGILRAEIAVEGHQPIRFRQFIYP